mmetsp:Transcript_183742/g.447377  ORF Transcript_183742/g.447377 Transcript_183742/m.447377 type:complete len:230 (-) Transcript_183742:3-692(-)
MRAAAPSPSLCTPAGTCTRTAPPAPCAPSPAAPSCTSAAASGPPGRRARGPRRRGRASGVALHSWSGGGRCTPSSPQPSSIRQRARLSAHAFRAAAGCARRATCRGAAAPGPPSLCSRGSEVRSSCLALRAQPGGSRAGGGCNSDFEAAPRSVGAVVASTSIPSEARQNGPAGASSHARRGTAKLPSGGGPSVSAQAGLVPGSLHCPAEQGCPWCAAVPCLGHAGAEMA